MHSHSVRAYNNQYLSWCHLVDASLRHSMFFYSLCVSVVSSPMMLSVSWAPFNLLLRFGVHFFPAREEGEMSASSLSNRSVLAHQREEQILIKAVFYDITYITFKCRLDDLVCQDFVPAIHQYSTFSVYFFTAVRHPSLYHHLATPLHNLSLLLNMFHYPQYCSEVK